MGDKSVDEQGFDLFALAMRRLSPVANNNRPITIAA
jgi:hypothetical protein